MARIAIIGTANTGKSTLVKALLNKYSNYTTPTRTYRDVIEDLNLNHSSGGDQYSQNEILDFLAEQISTNSEDNIIFDRCVIDAMIYTMYIADHNQNIDPDFIKLCINMTRESTKLLDLVFYVRHDNSIEVVDDGTRDVSCIKEVGHIFEAFYQSYLNDYGNAPWFPKMDDPKGWPPIIELSGSTEERLQQIADYLDNKGNLISPSDGGIAGIIDDYAKIDDMNNLDEIIDQQTRILDHEKGLKSVKGEEFGIVDSNGNFMN